MGIKIVLSLKVWFLLKKLLLVLTLKRSGVDRRNVSFHSNKPLLNILNNSLNNKTPVPTTTVHLKKALVRYSKTLLSFHLSPSPPPILHILNTDISSSDFKRLDHSLNYLFKILRNDENISVLGTQISSMAPFSFSASLLYIQFEWIYYDSLFYPNNFLPRMK